MLAVAMIYELQAIPPYQAPELPVKQQLKSSGVLYKNKTICVKEGQTFSISLPCFPVGYSWSLVEPYSDTNVQLVDSKCYYAYQNGLPANQEYIFLATQAGQETVRVEYGGSWFSKPFEVRIYRIFIRPRVAHNHKHERCTCHNLYNKPELGPIVHCYPKPPYR